MSGYPRCARAAPSRKRTSACTIEIGWSTTSIRSYGRPKRKCASISSRPLFASVAESTVIFGPIRHVGGARASSGVTSSSFSRLRPRNGPPEPVRTSDSTCSGARPSRHWKAAECSLSTGSSSPPPRSRAASASSPAATRLSLFASASVTPFSSAQSVAGSPAKPTTALSTTSGRARSSSSVRSPPTWVSGARPSTGCDPEAAATSSSPGLDSTISTACRPIEPVAPSRATRFICSKCTVGFRAWFARSGEGQDRVVGGDGREQVRVEAVEHAAVAGQQAPAVLDPQITLDGGLEQVAERRRDRDHRAEDERLTDCEEVLVVERKEGDEDRRYCRCDEAFPRLPRRKHGRELVPADQEAGEVRQRVGGEDGQQDGEGRKAPMLGDPAQQQDVGEAEADPAGADGCRRHRHRQRLARLRDAFQQEC